MTSIEIRNAEIAASLHLFCEPCRCGSTAIAEPIKINETVYWKIICSKCDISTLPFINLSTAVLVWNGIVAVSNSEDQLRG